MESQEIIDNTLLAAKSYFVIESIVLYEHFRASAIYHSGCMTKYLLKIQDETVDDICDHNQAFKNLIKDLIDNKRHFYFQLYWKNSNQIYQKSEFTVIRI